MTEATMYERMSAIRGEVIDLITSVTEPTARRELHADLVLDDLLAIANRLGRLTRSAGFEDRQEGVAARIAARS
jgi:hypothetical protein